MNDSSRHLLTALESTIHDLRARAHVGGPLITRFKHVQDTKAYLGNRAARRRFRRLSHRARKLLRSEVLGTGPGCGWPLCAALVKRAP